MPLEPTASESTWLREMERRMLADLPVDFKEMMVSLRDKLPRGFQPPHVSPWFVYGLGPSVEGLRAIGDSGRFLPDVERAILNIRDRLIQYPALNQIAAGDVAAALQVSIPRAERILGLMASIGPYFAGASGSPNGFSSISFGRDDVLAEYLGFRSIEDALARRAAERPLPSPPPSAPAGRGATGQVVVRNSAFILMSMNPLDDSLPDVCNAIKAACADFGIGAIRVDDIEHQEEITARVLEGIASAEFIIADLTGERPNVYYEIGYAHALGKKPMLFRKRGTPLHFDLSVHNAPEYRNNAELRSLLHKRLEAVLGRTPPAPLTST